MHQGEGVDFLNRASLRVSNHGDRASMMDTVLIGMRITDGEHSSDAVRDSEHLVCICKVTHGSIWMERVCKNFAVGVKIDLCPLEHDEVRPKCTRVLGRKVRDKVVVDGCCNAQYPDKGVTAADWSPSPHIAMDLSGKGLIA